MRHRILSLIVAGVALGAIPAGATISFTCNANIDNALAGTCGYLNGTIAGLYSGTFSNADASIYVEYGNTGLGSSVTAYDSSDYGTVRDAMLAETPSATQTSAYTASLPASTPFSTSSMWLTNANERALGLGSSFGGYTASGSSCGTVDGITCFDGIIKISSGMQTSGNLWYRGLSSGSQTSSQYDFFSVVEHETDEVLGTASCAFQQGGICSGGDFMPLDLFRYAGNGSLSFGAGDNNPCSTKEATNACLSIDGGVTFLAAYNNVNNGLDAGDFTGNCQHVQDAFGCPGQSLDITTDGGVEIKMLNLDGYELNQTSQVPEPLTSSLCGGGLLLLAGLGWRRRRR